MNRPASTALCSLLTLLLTASPAWGLSVSVGAAGINAQGLGLNGAGIAIGQVEPGRPGDPNVDGNGEWFVDGNANGYDGPANDTNGDGLFVNANDVGVDVNQNGVYDAGFLNAHPGVNPAGVFVRNQAAPAAPTITNAPPANWWIAGTPQQNFTTADHNINNHATQVAGVMISTAGGATGVAPGAMLFSGADAAVGPNFDLHTVITAQNISQQNNGDVRAINMSFGNPLAGGTHDGSSLLSQFVDYSSLVTDTLYVTASDEQGAIIPASPQDSFNRLNVGYTRNVGGTFNQVDPGNIFTTTVDGRRITDVVAPGTNINMPALGGGLAQASGSSFAAPHVTGAVALLHQSAANQGMSSFATDHRTTKAILMNSAEKRAGTLGAQKSILDTNGQNWFASDAFTNDFIPLDDQLGVGQIEVSRAIRNLSGGEQDAFSGPVSKIGWSWDITLGAGDHDVFVLEDALSAGDWVSITLVWDRVVILNDTGADGFSDTNDPGEGNAVFDAGESFFTVGLTDMDLYFLPKDSESVGDAVCQSVSSQYSVEHIMCQAPQDGEYEFWVRQLDQPLGQSPNGDQSYAVAWWVPAPPPWALLLAALPFFRRRR